LAKIGNSLSRNEKYLFSVTQFYGTEWTVKEGRLNGGNVKGKGERGKIKENLKLKG
jgi:hypothetical protein